jgi:hypothetical protein
MNEAGLESDLHIIMLVRLAQQSKLRWRDSQLA